MMIDPLQKIYELEKPVVSSIKQMSSGKTYVGLMLENGNIGVAATLMNDFEPHADFLLNPDFENFSHRCVLQAYYNARYNYDLALSGQADIFERIDFSKAQNIVMIGFFRSLVKKFETKNIPLTIFDRLHDDAELTSMDKQTEHIQNASVLVISSTSIINGTFHHLVSECAPDCKVFMLGPSSPFHPIMFSYPGIEIVFGAQFEKFDKEVLNIIRNNGGTPMFLHLMKKVYIERNMQR